MAESQKCPQCGSTLPPDAPHGVCPRCVLGLGLPGESTADVTAPLASRFALPTNEELVSLFPSLEILGVVCTFWDHTNVARDVINQLRGHFGELVFTTTIPKNVSLEEAHSRHTHVFEHAPTSAGALAYRAFVKEVIAR